MIDTIRLRFYKAKLRFNLVFTNNTFLLCFFIFFWITELYMLIPVVIAQTFNPVAELAIPTVSPTNEANADVETQPLIAEIKKENFQSNLKSCTRTFFVIFTHLIIIFLFLLKGNFLFHLFFSLKSRFTFSFSKFLLKVLIYCLVILLIVKKSK